VQYVTPPPPQSPEVLFCQAGRGAKQEQLLGFPPPSRSAALRAGRRWPPRLPTKRAGLKTRAPAHVGLRHAKKCAKLRNISNRFQSFPYEMPLNVSGSGVSHAG